MRRIAVWNTAFLGDAVLTLPLVQSLKLRYPAAAIDYYVRGGLETLFAGHPALNAAYGYAKRGGRTGLARLCGDVRQRRYDLWISAHGSPRSALIALASGAKVRIGYNAPAINRLAYTGTVNRRFTELDEIERLLELLHPLGEGPVSHWPEPAPGTAEMEEAARFFAPLEGPALGLHPGSVWATKRWPAAYFAEIGRRALEHGAHVALFAGPGEEEIAGIVRRQIADGVSGHAVERLHDCSGKLSLPLLAAYLGKLSCYLTNDSGPMHLAWAQRVPVTAVFGPTVRQLGFFPRGERSTVLETSLSCRPCGLHGPTACPLGHHRCMKDLLPSRVWEDVAGKLWPGSV